MNITPGRYRMENGKVAVVLARLSDGCLIGEIDAYSPAALMRWNKDGSASPFSPMTSLIERIGDIEPPPVITGPGVYETRDGDEISIIGRSTVGTGLWVGEDCTKEFYRWCDNGRSYDGEAKFDLIRRLRDLPDTSRRPKEVTE